MVYKEKIVSGKEFMFRLGLFAVMLVCIAIASTSVFAAPTSEYKVQQITGEGRLYVQLFKARQDYTNDELAKTMISIYQKNCELFTGIRQMVYFSFSDDRYGTKFGNLYYNAFIQHYVGTNIKNVIFDGLRQPYTFKGCEELCKLNKGKIVCNNGNHNGWSK